MAINLWGPRDAVVGTTKSLLLGVVDNVVCPIARTYQSAIASNFPAPAAFVNELYTNAICGEPVDPNRFQKGVPFTGGQCPTPYFIRFNHPDRVGPPQQTLLAGPLTEIFVRQSGSNTEQGVVRNAAGGEQVLTPLFGDDANGDPVRLGYSFDSLVTVSGAPDNCGDLPGVYPDVPGDIVPPVPGDILSLPQTVAIDVDIDGVTVPINFEVGEIVLSPSFNLVIPINDREYELTPEMDLLTPEEVAMIVGNELASIEEVIGEIVEDTASIKEDLEAEFVGDFGWSGCDGEFQTNVVGGMGLTALFEAVNQTNLASNERLKILCEEGKKVEKQQATTLLYSGTLDLATEAGIPLDLDPEVRVVYVQVSPPEVANTTYKGLARFNQQGRFGQVFFGYQNGQDTYWSEPYHCYFELCQFTVPCVEGLLTKIRVSSAVGATFQIFDAGVRQP